MLRGSYHQLSADPGSLANLDQDLPNNLQHQLPIFSLPQEWLWCETWCSDASKKKAKTIDLVCARDESYMCHAMGLILKSIHIAVAVQQPAHQGAKIDGSQAHRRRVDRPG